MKKLTNVFAVLTFFAFTSSCSALNFHNEKNPLIHINDNIVNSVIGDFNGDGINEHIYVSKFENGNSYIKLVINNKSYYKKLNRIIDSFNSHVTDINGDGKEEFILYTSENSHEKMYIFAFNDDLDIVLSPEILQKKFNLIKSNNEYVFAFGSFEKKFNLKDNLDMEFYHTDISYKDSIPELIVDGIIKSPDEKYYTFTISFSINKNYDFEIREANLLPYIE